MNRDNLIGQKIAIGEDIYTIVGWRKISMMKEDFLIDTEDDLFYDKQFFASSLDLQQCKLSLNFNANCTSFIKCVEGSKLPLELLEICNIQDPAVITTTAERALELLELAENIDGFFDGNNECVLDVTWIEDE